jgi:hypothetical protein
MHTRQILTIDSLTGGGDLSADRTLALVNDVVTPTNGQVYMFRNGARAWARPNLINVVDYGADPTGSVNSTTAITNAVAALPGVLFFPSGTYLVSAPITISQPCLIMGAGKWASTISTNSATANIFNFSTAGVALSELGFNSSVTRTGGYYLSWTGALTLTSGCHIYECAFRNYFNALLFQGPTVGVPYIGDLQIRNCYFLSGNSGNGISFANAPCTFVLIRDSSWVNTGSQTTQTAIQINVMGDATIENCNMEGIGLGIACQASGSGTSAITQVTAKGCVIDNCSGGILIQGNSAAALNNTTISDCWCVGNRTYPGLFIQANGTSVITGVQVINSQFMSGLTSIDGIQLSAVAGASIKRVLINNCRAESNGGNGINLNSTGLNDIVLTANEIAANTSQGLNIAASVTNFQFIGNRITANAGWGMAFGTGINNCVILGNSMLGNTAGEQFQAPAASATVVNTNNI